MVRISETDPWDIATPITSQSGYCCTRCETINLDRASQERTRHGLFAARDLQYWPPRAVQEMVHKMLAVIERPPVDATGYYPGIPNEASRPVTTSDIQVQPVGGLGGVKRSTEDFWNMVSYSLSSRLPIAPVVPVLNAAYCPSLRIS